MGAGGDAGADVFQAAATFAKRRAEKMKDSAAERRESTVQRVRLPSPDLPCAAGEKCGIAPY